MNRLQLVVYPLRDVLFGWKQIGDMLGEENLMLMPELFYEANERAPVNVPRVADDGHSPFMSRQSTLMPMLLLLPAYPACAKVQRPCQCIPVHVP